MDFVANASAIHAQVHDNLQLSSAIYKESADRHRQDVQFKVVDHVWAVLTRERFPPGEYKKLKSRKVCPLEVLEKISSNAYCLLFPQDARYSYVFNVNISFLFWHDDTTDPRSDLSSPRVT